MVIANKDKQKRQKPLHSVLGNTIYVLKEIIHGDKVLFLYLILEAAFGIVVPFFSIYLPKLVLDLITQRATVQQLVAGVGSITLAMTLAKLLYKFSSVAKYLRYNDMRQDLLTKIFTKTLTCDYIQLESEEGRTRLQKANENTRNGDQSGFSIMMSNLTGVFVSALSFVLFSGIIGTLNPVILLLLMLTAVINFFTLSYVRKYRENLIAVQTPEDKKLNYISGVTSDFQYGKDIRVYNYKKTLVDIRDKLVCNIETAQRKSQNKQYFATIINALLVFVRDGAAYVYLIFLAANGKIAVGDFVLYFGAIAGFAGLVTQLIDNYHQLCWGSLKLNHMRDFLEYMDEPNLDFPQNIPMGNPTIEFKNVNFSYTEDSKKILDNFSLKIKSGEKIALVGVNGAGKTTIVKLLCGFYKPNSGQILINGVDMAQIKKEVLFKQFSAVFQDILILPNSISENVSLKIMEKTDIKLVQQCLEMAGLLSYVESLPKGLDSPMLRISEDDGIILSGGQQQRLMLARALYKDAPILLLDEPTAALDPIAESEVYKRYHDFAGNKTSIFISHRLASTRFCDRIVFLDNGKPIEIGSHEELIARKGKYAEMFEIQSRYYKKNAVVVGGEASEAV